MSDSIPDLSARGFQRKDRILSLALRAARRRRYRRLARNGAVFALVLIAGMATWRMAERKPATVKNGNVVLQRNQAVKPSGVTILWIQTDPNVLKRMEEPPRAGTWQRIGDDELLRSLADAGHPAGLLEIGGRVVLLPRN
ncbi:MAG: hypothetical protein ABSB42_09400 [Tepidisphaeraceae bacterium]|jgi:hypothetical protein